MCLDVVFLAFLEPLLRLDTGHTEATRIHRYLQTIKKPLGEVDDNMALGGCFLITIRKVLHPMLRATHVTIPSKEEAIARNTIRKSPTEPANTFLTPSVLLCRLKLFPLNSHIPNASHLRTQNEEGFIL